MDEKLKAQINKIPFIPVVTAVLLYFAYDYYSFLNDADSPLNQRKSELAQSEAEIQGMVTKLKAAQQFVRDLETKKAELRGLVQQLESLKATVTESLDVADFLRMTTTEGRRVGLHILSMRPTGRNELENYVEHGFEMAFRGVFVQLLVLLDRLSQTQKVIKIEMIQMKPITSSLSRYVEIEGSVQLKAFTYKPSPVDTLGMKERPIDLPNAAAAGGGK